MRTCVLSALYRDDEVWAIHGVFREPEAAAVAAGEVIASWSEPNEESARASELSNWGPPDWPDDTGNAREFNASFNTVFRISEHPLE
jgi:hypothetical protein